MNKKSAFPDEAATAPASATLRKDKSEDRAFAFERRREVDTVVEHGDARGRTMGFPTANMHLEVGYPPPFGVYAVD